MHVNPIILIIAFFIIIVLMYANYKFSSNDDFNWYIESCLCFFASFVNSFSCKQTICHKVVGF